MALTVGIVFFTFSWFSKFVTSANNTVGSLLTCCKIKFILLSNTDSYLTDFALHVVKNYRVLCSVLFILLYDYQSFRLVKNIYIYNI